MFTLPRLQIVANLAVSAFFLTFLAFEKGYNYASFFLASLGVGYLIFHLIKKQKWLFLSAEKWLVWSYLFYFLTFLLAFFVHGEKANTLDNSLKILIFLPLLFLFGKLPLKLTWLLHSIPFGALIAGIVAIYQRFVLHSLQAFSGQMHIQAGDMAMSIGLFALIISLYFVVQKQSRFAVLYFIFALFGIMASVLSTARGGWISVPFILAFILFTYRRFLPKSVLIGVPTLVSLAIIGLILMSNSKMTMRIQEANNDIQAYMTQGNGSTSIGARFDMWKSALIATQENPIFGVGTMRLKQVQQDLANQGKISQYAAGFDHVHNQYLDNLAKRGVIGLFGLLMIFLVPLIYFFNQALKTDMLPKTTALLGVTHIISVMSYCLSQGFFTHNSGSIFYFFLVVIFYCAQRSAERKY